MSSQVITFYEDEAKTNAIYPRTKLSAISDDDGKALSETIGELNNKTRINYLRPALQTTTRNGVTCTNNGDGTFTLNGTATSNIDFTILLSQFKAGTYKLVGCPQGGSYGETYYMLSYGPSYNPQAKDSGNGGNITLSNTTVIRTDISIISGTVCNNLVFKPMLTDDLSATYDDFVPFDASLAVNSLAAQKQDILTLEEIQASTDLTGKIASASALLNMFIGPLPCYIYDFTEDPVYNQSYAAIIELRKRTTTCFGRGSIIHI